MSDELSPRETSFISKATPFYIPFLWYLNFASIATYCNPTSDMSIIRVS